MAEVILDTPTLLHHRCSDTRRSLVSNGTYVEVALQKGDEKLYICCPRNMQGEMRKYMAQCKQQGYGMVLAPDDQQM